MERRPAKSPRTTTKLMARSALSFRALALTGALTSCAPTGQMAKASSPAIGCEADQIQISDPYGTGIRGSVATWVATCEGTRYFCETLHESVVCTDLPEGFEFSES